MLSGAITDRFGRRRLTFMTCMFGIAGLVILCPFFTIHGPSLSAGAIIVAFGFGSGSVVLFFPIMLDDPAVGGTHASQSIGLATAASYAGGFVVPFLLAPFPEAYPIPAIAACGIAFGCAGAAMFLSNRSLA